jgi:hypothetical protein
MNRRTSLNHQFKAVSLAGADLVSLQQEVCTGLSEFANVLVTTKLDEESEEGTVVLAQHVFIQQQSNETKLHSYTLLALLESLYPQSAEVVCTSVASKRNENRVVVKMTTNIVAPPSVINFEHIQMSMEWRVQSHAKLCFEKGLATETNMKTLLQSLEKDSKTDQFFVNFKVRRGLALKMFKEYIIDEATAYTESRLDLATDSKTSTQEDRVDFSTAINSDSVEVMLEFLAASERELNKMTCLFFSYFNHNLKYSLNYI